MSVSPVEFEQACQETLAQVPYLTPAARQCLIEDLRLRFQFPGEYVAYLDHYEIVNNVYQLTREGLAHSPTPEGIQQAVDECSEEDLGKLVIDYADPLKDDHRSQSAETAPFEDCREIS